MNEFSKNRFLFAKGDSRWMRVAMMSEGGAVDGFTPEGRVVYYNFVPVDRDGENTIIVPFDEYFKGTQVRALNLGEHRMEFVENRDDGPVFLAWSSRAEKAAKELHLDLEKIEDRKRFIDLFREENLHRSSWEDAVPHLKRLIASSI
jgi:hypothetical protein